MLCSASSNEPGAGGASGPMRWRPSLARIQSPALPLRRANMPPGVACGADGRCYHAPALPLRVRFHRLLRRSLGSGHDELRALISLLDRRRSALLIGYNDGGIAGGALLAGGLGLAALGSIVFAASFAGTFGRPRSRPSADRTRSPLSAWLTDGGNKLSNCPCGVSVGGSPCCGTEGVGEGASTIGEDLGGSGRPAGRPRAVAHWRRLPICCRRPGRYPGRGRGSRILAYRASVPARNDRALWRGRSRGSTRSPHRQRVMPGSRCACRQPCPAARSLRLEWHSRARFWRAGRSVRLASLGLRVPAYRRSRHNSAARLG